MKTCFAVCLLLCFSFAGAALADDIYRWTDADGRVHYGSRPPPGVAAESKSITTRPPGDDPALTERRERQRRLLESYDYERGREAELAERQRQQDKQRAARCREIERRLRQLDVQTLCYNRQFTPYQRNSGVSLPPGKTTSCRPGHNHGAQDTRSDPTGDLDEEARRRCGH